MLLQGITVKKDVLTQHPALTTHIVLICEEANFQTALLVHLDIFV